MSIIRERPTVAVRASDAERDAVVQALGAAHAEGRLTMDELQERVERGVAARTREDLDALTADLPARPRVRPTADPALLVLLGLALALVVALFGVVVTRGAAWWVLIWLPLALAARGRRRRWTRWARWAPR